MVGAFQFSLEFQTLSQFHQVRNWSGRQDSNLRPSGPKPDALPGCATPRVEETI